MKHLALGTEVVVLTTDPLLFLHIYIYPFQVIELPVQYVSGSDQDHVYIDSGKLTLIKHN
jgi:hypothetical protein